MGCLAALLLGAVLLFLLGPALVVMGGLLTVWEWIKPPFIWLWENRVLLSFITMGVMLVPWIFMWIDDRDRKARRRRTEDQDSLRKARKSNYEIYLERRRKREEEDQG